MCKSKMHVAPVLLTLILELTVKENLCRGLVVSENNFSMFISGPIAIGIIAVTIISWIYVLIREFKIKKQWLQSSTA